jgi:hypothetical protein
LRLSIRVEMSAFSNHLRASRDSIELWASRPSKDSLALLYTSFLQSACYGAIEELPL